MSAEDPASDILPLIQQHTGLVASVQRTERGFSSDLTAIVECEKGPYFVKAVRNRPGGRRDSLVRERVISEFTRSISPAMLWEVEADSWLVLGYEAVEGRRANLKPDSSDLPTVVDLVGRIGELALPDVAAEWAETRWNRFAADPSEAELFRGHSLLHTDINPSNFMIGKRSWVVDWAWPTRGAGFIDPAILVVQLIASGHSPEEAEAWVADGRVWREASPLAIDAFTAAQVRMHRRLVERNPDESWLKAMLVACQDFADHRGVTVS
ncbi:hypothetical protein [Streptomyces prunicolor]|uniref:hypothetical protein n=1 Tax=Streptomyces prunicolor TaxID=67348 RepID=UPI00341BE827